VDLSVGVKKIFERLEWVRPLVISN